MFAPCPLQRLAAFLSVVIVLAFAASRPESTAHGASGATTIGATVPSAIALDVSGCGGASLQLGPLVSGSTSITPIDCAVSFGSSNDAASLRVQQADGSGTALTQFAPASTVHRAANEYWGVTAATATKAWAAGRSGQPTGQPPIMHTTDGGATWTAQTPCAGAGGTFTEIDHVTADTVVAVTSYGQTCRTTDGGANWSTVIPAPATSWYGVDILPSGIGWLVGSSGRVHHTTDGGASWAPLSIPDPTLKLWDVDATSATSLYAVGMSSGLLPNVYALTSHDGGITWSQFLIGNTQNGGYSTSIAALDATHAVAASSYGIWQTADGGTTWTRRSSSGSICVTALDATTALVYHGRGSAVRRSTDAGATWTDIAGSSTLLTGYTRGCAAAGASTAYVSGSNDQLMRTTDVGSTHTVAPSSFRGLTGVAAWNTDTFVAVGDDGAIRRSSDGGVTVSLPASGTSSDLTGVEVAGGNTAVAVGSGGTIIRSTDTGATWASVASGTGARLEDVEMSATGRMWAAGVGGVVLRSDDSGATWTQTTSPAAMYIIAVAAYGRNEAWVAGAGGAIWYTADGGATWAAQSSGTTVAIRSIDTVDGQGLVATTNTNGSVGSTVVRTTDGGANWTPAVMPYSVYSYAVSYLTPTDLVITASNGYRRSTDGGATWVQHSGSPNPYAVAPLDANAFILAGAYDLIATVRPTASFADYSSGSVDFGGSSSVFGACLQTATGVASTVWPIAGAGSCTATNTTLWRGVPAAGGSGATIASTATGDTGDLTLRFGAKPNSVPSGPYSAGLRFEAVSAGV